MTPELTIGQKAAWLESHDYKVIKDGEKSIVYDTMDEEYGFQLTGEFEEVVTEAYEFLAYVPPEES
jgi:hypothetical protein